MPFNKKLYNKIIQSLKQTTRVDNPIIVNRTKYFTIEECSYKNILVYVLLYGVYLYRRQ